MLIDSIDLKDEEPVVRVGSDIDDDEDSFVFWIPLLSLRSVKTSFPATIRVKARRAAVTQNGIHRIMLWRISGNDKIATVLKQEGRFYQDDV